MGDPWNADRSSWSRAREAPPWPPRPPGTRLTARLQDEAALSKGLGGNFIKQPMVLSRFPGPSQTPGKPASSVAIQRLFLNISVQPLQICFLEGLLSVVVYREEFTNLHFFAKRFFKTVKHDIFNGDGTT